MKYILTSLTSRVLHIELNRPDKHNAFHPEMIAELTQEFQKWSKPTTDVLAILLSGKGKSFSAGADLEYMRAMAKFSSEENIADAGKLFDLFWAIRKASPIVIAKVHGHVMGGGLGLVAASDFAVADHDTQFAFTEVRMGLVPAVISPFVLSRMAPAHARYFMTTGLNFTAAEALASGLVQFSGSAEQIEDWLKKTLNSICNAGVEAVSETKRLASELLPLDIAGFRERCSKLIAERRKSPEGQEGILSFLEKRSPNWRKE